MNLGGEDLRELMIIEVPKGIVEVLYYICRKNGVRYSDLVERGITRWTAEESIKRLTEIGVLVPYRRRSEKASEQWHMATMKGRELVEGGRALYGVMQKVRREIRPVRLLKLPLSSFPLLAVATDAGMTWFTDAIGKLSICRATATKALKALKREGLLEAQASRGFPISRILYSPTRGGQMLGKVLLELYPHCKSLSKSRSQNLECHTMKRRTRSSKLQQSDLREFSRTGIRQ